MNTAEQGDILKVWEGQIEYGKDLNFECAIYSDDAISSFQKLAPLPNTIIQSGRAKTHETVQYFSKYLNSRYKLKGWVEMKEHPSSLPAS